MINVYLAKGEYTNQYYLVYYSKNGPVQSAGDSCQLLESLHNIKKEHKNIDIKNLSDKLKKEHSAIIKDNLVDVSKELIENLELIL